MTHMRPITLLLAAATAFAAEAVQTPIDNDQVKVLNVTVQPHEKTRQHQHKVNRVMIYLTAGRQDFEWADGKKTSISFKAGQALWSPAAGLHIAEIASPNPVNIIEVELKKPASGAPVPSSDLEPIKVAAKTYKVEMENPQVRVLRVKIAPHQMIPMHEHMLNRVVVYLTDQHVRATSADGKAETMEHKPGDATWGGPTKHKEENLTDKPVELVVVELKP